MKRIFFSDLHLEDSGSEVFRAFASMVRHEARIVDEIYILGDLVEMWVGDDDTSQAAEQIVSVLREASAACSRVCRAWQQRLFIGRPLLRAHRRHAIGRPFYSR